MKFTVLGASGVIGTHMVHYLRLINAEVSTPARDDKRIFSESLGHVIYAIGVTADFRVRPFDTVNAHVCVLNDILQKADFSSLLYLSSTRLYSGAATGSEQASFSVTPFNSSDLYNISKLMGESLCLSCNRKNVRIARLSNVVGGGDEHTENFVPSLLRDAKKGKILLRSDPSSAKDYIHIDDVVRLLHKIAHSGRHAIYNVASGRQIRHAEWINRLQTLTGCVYEVEAGAPLLRFEPIEISRIEEEFNFQPRSALSVLQQEGGFAFNKEKS